MWYCLLKFSTLIIGLINLTLGGMCYHNILSVTVNPKQFLLSSQSYLKCAQIKVEYTQLFEMATAFGVRRPGTADVLFIHLLLSLFGTFLPEQTPGFWLLCINFYIYLKKSRGREPYIESCSHQLCRLQNIALFD